MLRFSFKRGLRFYEGHRVWTVARRLENKRIQLEDGSGEIRNMTDEEIMQKYIRSEFVVDLESVNSDGSSCHIVVPRDLSAFKEEEQQEAIRRQKYLEILDECGEVGSTGYGLQKAIEEAAQRIGDKSPPSPSSIGRWKARYEATKSIQALVSRHENKGRRTGMSAEVLNLVDEAIESVYLHPQKYPKKEVYEQVQRAIRTRNKAKPEEKLIEPSLATIYRYLGRLSRYEVDVDRLGKSAADKKHGSAIGTVNVKRIHERWEIDHTPLDFLCFCEISGLPMGRPWITVIIDRYSRYILGFYISFQHPSANSVLQAIAHAILPKEDLLADYPDIKTGWSARGIGERIVLDNGMDFHSGSFIKASHELGIELAYCPAKAPQYKGAIERFFRTINHDLIHRLPGTVFNNKDERGEYESEKLASISFQVLKHLVVKWIVEIYHQRPHRSTKVTPQQLWDKGLSERVIEYPVSPEQLRIIVGKTETRTLFHYGIELDGLKYNSTHLQHIKRRTGKSEQVIVKFSDEDVGYIHVFDAQEKGYVKVPAVHRDYAERLHRAQHKLIREKARKEGIETKDIDRMLEVKEEMALIIRAAIKSKKMIDRKKAAQARAINSNSPIQKLEEASKSVKNVKTKEIEEEYEEEPLDDEWSSIVVDRGVFRAI